MSKTKQWLDTRVGRILAYFLQGLLLIAPMFVTIYVIVYFFNALDTKLNDVFEAVFHIRLFIGFGIIITFALITMIGFIGSSVFVQPVLHIIDLIIEKTPLVKDLYSSLKDFFGAFISNKKKFNKPVLFEMGKGTGVFKLGFITQEDLTHIGIEDKVAVYTPWSYNLSGTLFIVDRDQLHPLDDVRSADMMKFIVSGGVTAIEDEAHHHTHHHQHQ